MFRVPTNLVGFFLLIHFLNTSSLSFSLHSHVFISSSSRRLFEDTCSEEEAWMQLCLFPFLFPLLCLSEREGRGKSPEIFDSIVSARVLIIVTTCEDNLLLEEFKNMFLLSYLDRSE
jgi:hypothetical protein